MGLQTYTQNQNTTSDPRTTEYRLLGQVTAALSKAKDKPEDIKAKVNAVMWNRDVWSAFRVDLVDPDNQLPQDIKASLISISLWVNKETFEVLDNKSDLEALIEINKTIMEGLKQNTAKQ